MAVQHLQAHKADACALLLPLKLQALLQHPLSAHPSTDKQTAAAHQPNHAAAAAPPRTYECEGQSRQAHTSAQLNGTLAGGLGTAELALAHVL
jgi:hypothetical protein